VATSDVPGAKASNGDKLGVGCWAEHEDGSLILVEGLESGSVVYSIFDLAKEPPVEYRDAMPEIGFKDQFSWKSDDDIKWTWHDKTAFPWDRVMVDFPAGQRHTSAQSILSVAERIADRLGLRAQKLRPHQRDTGRGMLARIGRAIVEELERDDA